METRKWITPFRKQTWAVSGALLTNVVQGMIMSYTSSLLPALRDPDSTIKADLDTASWIASSIGVTYIPAFFLSSFLMECWGRRMTHGLFLIPGILGWFFILFASNVEELLIGRILGGATCGGTTFLCAVIIGEYSSPEYRGVFLNLKTVLFSIGCMIVHIPLFYVSWRTIALIGVIPNAAALLITLTWPESPAWLASKGQFERCEKAFFWLRESNENSIKELEEMIKAQKRISVPEEKSSIWNKIVNLMKKFKRKDFLKPLSIIFLGMTLLELSGRHIFPAYATDIIGEITGDKSQSFYCLMVLDITVTASTSFSSFLVKLMKRRTLLFGSGIAALATLGALCTYLYLVPKEIIIHYPWIPILILIVYFVFASLGCTPIPLGLLGEIIPLAHRGAGTVVGGLMIFSSLYAVLVSAPYLLANTGVRGTLASLGAGMAACLLILYFILPETKDRTLQEIENFFTYGQYTIEHEADDKDRNEVIRLA